MSDVTPSPRPLGLLCALAQELGDLPDRARSRRSLLGQELLELDLPYPVLATVTGVGKVAAARGAALLLAQGAGGILVVGTCGGLSRGLEPGSFVHCSTAFQVDLGIREGRATEADSTWREAWRRAAPGEQGWFLTADKAVLSHWRRFRLRRAFSGLCVADMETAAAAAVASSAGLPFAALRVVTDRAGWGTSGDFRRNFDRLAGQPAASLPALLEQLGPEPVGPFPGAR